MKRQPQTQGGRIARRGTRMIWAGPLIVPVGLILGLLHAPTAVLIAVLVVLFVIALAGVAVALYANSVLGREIRGAPDGAAGSGTRQPQPGNRGTRS